MATYDGAPPDKPNAIPLKIIELKKPVGSIPDEYLCCGNGVSLRIFYSDNQCHNAQTVIDTFQGRIGATDAVKHPTDSTFRNTLKQISEANYEHKCGLILMILGDTKENFPRGCFLPTYAEHEFAEPIDIQKVWSKFLLTKTLKNKPKIFFFVINEMQNYEMATDSVLKDDGRFDVPVEADIFIVYLVVQDDSFITSFCEEISNRGHLDHIAALVAHAGRTSTTPLTISTLTRKFYITSNELRSCYFQIHSNLDALIDSVDNITRNMKSDDCVDKSSHIVALPEEDETGSIDMKPTVSVQATASKPNKCLGSCPDLETDESLLSSPTPVILRRKSVSGVQSRSRSNSNTAAKPRFRKTSYTEATKKTKPPWRN